MTRLPLLTTLAALLLVTTPSVDAADTNKAGFTPLSNGVDLTGWELQDARGISADGKVIVGTGINPAGFAEAWIATIPEPSTGLLLASGFVGLGARRALFKLSRSGGYTR